MSDFKEFVYGLYYINESGIPTFFYVGRSGRGLNRSPGVRFREHLAHARHEGELTDVYTFMRDVLNKNKIQCFEEILCWCSEDEATVDDTEFFWVREMLKANQPLKNQKNGDAKKYVEAEESLKTDYVINSPKDVAGYRQYVADRKKQLLKNLDEMNTSLEKEHGVLSNKSNPKSVLSSIKKAEPEEQPKESELPIYSDRAQEAFQAGKYSLALTYLGGSHLRFAEQFGLTYTECLS